MWQFFTRIIDQAAAWLSLLRGDAQRTDRPALGDPEPSERSSPGLANPREEQTWPLIPGVLTLFVREIELETRFGAIPCVVYRSSGLASQGQEELVFCVRRRRVEDRNRDLQAVAEILQAIYGFAAEGQRADEGQMTLLNIEGRGLFGREDFCGFLYLVCPADLLPEGAGRHLVGLALTAREVGAIRHMGWGQLRVIARLGDWARWFPAPPWTDPERPEMVYEAEEMTSMIARVNRAVLQHSDIYDDGPLEHDVPVKFCIAPGDRAVVRDTVSALREGQPIGYVGALGPEFEGLYMWRPGQESRHCIVGPDERATVRGGNFLIVSPAVEGEAKHAVEDGFAILLSPSNWARWVAAIEAEENLRLFNDSGALLLELRWLPSGFVDPFTNVSQECPRGLRSLGPPSSCWRDPHLNYAGMVMHEGQDELRRRMVDRSLWAFVDALVLSTREVAAGLGECQGCMLFLEVDGAPGEEPQLSLRVPSALGDVAGRALAAANRSPPPLVVDVPVRFELALELRGGVMGS